MLLVPPVDREALFVLCLALAPAVDVAEQPARAGCRVRAQPRAHIDAQPDPPVWPGWQRQPRQRAPQPRDGADLGAARAEALGHIWAHSIRHRQYGSGRGSANLAHRKAKSISGEHQHRACSDRARTGNIACSRTNYDLSRGQ
jgi:hypothetical protein